MDAAAPPGTGPAGRTPPGSVPAQTVPASAPVAAEVAPPSAAPPGDRVVAAGATWPCEGCGHGNLLSEDACAACGTAFLAAVRQEAPTLVLPVVGDLAVLPQARRVALAVGLVIAFLVVAALLGLLIA